MVGTYPVKHSFSIGLNIMLHTRFKKVGTHPVTNSFSNVWDTLDYIDSFLNGWWILGYMLVYKVPGHTQLHTRFQMVVPHPVSHSICNGRDTPC